MLMLSWGMAPLLCPAVGGHRDLQLFTGYFRQALVFVWNSSISIFQELLASIEEIFIFAGGLGTGLVSIEIFLILPIFLRF